ncbi:MAG: hypothetical protein AB7L91_01940 [Dehalococcoidia bacterium]
MALIDHGTAAPGRWPWLALARAAALVLGSLVTWIWWTTLSEGLSPATATAWTMGFAVLYLALVLVSRWPAGLALGVLAGAGGAVASYALVVLVAIGGSVAMSAEAVRSGRQAMLVLVGLGSLHLVLAGASLMALLHASRTRQAASAAPPA